MCPRHLYTYVSTYVFTWICLVYPLFASWWSVYFRKLWVSPSLVTTTCASILYVISSISEYTLIYFVRLLVHYFDLYSIPKADILLLPLPLLLCYTVTFLAFLLHVTIIIHTELILPCWEHTRTRLMTFYRHAFFFSTSSPLSTSLIRWYLRVTPNVNFY